MTAATAAPETAGAHEGKLPAPDSFVVEFVTEDGVAGRVGLADAWPVRFEAMAPFAGSLRADSSGICRADGGRLPIATMWATSRGWNAIT